MRVSDEEREGVIARLGVALGEGRLALPEFEERAGAVARARTGDELAVLTADLPDPAAARREWWNEIRYWAGGAIIMTAIWAGQWIVDGDRPDYWPALPLLVWAGILVAAALWPRSAADKPRSGENPAG